MPVGEGGGYNCAPLKIIQSLPEAPLHAPVCSLSVFVISREIRWKKNRELFLEVGKKKQKERESRCVK